MDNHRLRLLIVDDEEKARKVLGINFQDKYNVSEAKNGAEAVKLLEKEQFDVVLTDVKMPEMSGIELLRYVRDHFKWVPVVVMTAFGSVENAVEAMKAGAYDYILKPIKIEDTETVVKRAMEHSATLQENIALKEKLKAYEAPQDIITINPEMRSLLDLAREVAVTDASVLIEGESGTGKELFARAHHRMSSRSEGPFIEVNCGAIPH